MKSTIQIIYCTSWGYLDQAVSLSKSILGKYKNTIQSVDIKPSSGGVFEVLVDGKNIFSKLEVGRFPNEEEIHSSLASLLT